MNETDETTDSLRTIEVVVAMTEADWRRVLFRYNKKIIVLLSALSAGCGAVAITMVLIDYYVQPKKDEIFGYLVFALILATTLCSYIVAFQIYTIRRQSQILAKKFVETKFWFSAHGLQTNTQDSSSVMAWTVFESVKETDSDFLFFPQEAIFFAVPKRFFTSEQSIDDLRILVSERAVCPIHLSRKQVL